MLAAASLCHAQPGPQFRVLMFAGHDYWHNPTIPNAVYAFEALAEEHNFAFQWTQDQAFFSHRSVKPFDVLVFLHSHAEDFSDEDKAKLQAFVRDGGAVIGIHAVIGGGEWPWFDKLVGRRFKFHPVQQTAVVNVADPAHSSTLHLPNEFLWTDEYYVFGEPLADDLHLILRVDNSTYDSKGDQEDPTALTGGAYLPLSWCHEYDGGRAFYTALGHRPALYKDRAFRDHIFGGICWALDIAQKESD